MNKRNSTQLTSVFAVLCLLLANPNGSYGTSEALTAPAPTIEKTHLPDLTKQYSEEELQTRSGLKGVVDEKLHYTTLAPTHRTARLNQEKRPSVQSSLPADGATGIGINEGISTDQLMLPGGLDMDRATINEETVLLYQLDANDEEIGPVAGRVGDTGGGDGIRFDPLQPLLPDTKYKFVVTDGVKLTDGTAFIPFEATFTTGSGTTGVPEVLPSIEFVRQPAVAEPDDSSVNDYFTSLVVGPDGKLYASTIAGEIKRWVIQADGTLSEVEILTPPLTSSRLDGSGGTEEARTIVGLVFAPEATATELVAYISHSKSIDFNSFSSEPLDWDGKITRLTGDELQTVQDIVIHLPRSLKDHLTNSIVFDPVQDQVLYVNQGSNSGGGALDDIWRKEERLLSGAILKLDLSKLPTSLPLDVLTTDDISVINSAPAGSIQMTDGTYNPYATQSPLTIFASGVRNAYDLVWHSNGELYVPANGTGGGSSTPGSADYVTRDPSGQGVRRITGEFYNHTTFLPVAPTSFNETQKDWLFNVVQNGYYGHPNPYRGEFVMNHGGQTYQGISGQNNPHIDVANYDDTVLPDPNFRTPAYDFGVNISPNGVIEYRSNAFGGALQGMLLVTRFSNGNDIILLVPDETGRRIERAYAEIPGLVNLDDPLDIVEDPKTGNLYVSEYDRNGSQPVLSLLKVKAGEEAVPAPELRADTSAIILEAVAGEVDRQEVAITNIGTAPLVITDVRIEGEQADLFSLAEAATVILPPGDQSVYSVTFEPTATPEDMGFNSAYVVFEQTNGTLDTLGLYALKKQGLGGRSEPTFQDVARTLGIGIDVGWEALETGVDPLLRGEEIEASQFVRAGNAPVTVTPVARYSPAERLPFGWYTQSAGAINYQPVGVLADGESNAQTLLPPLDSGTYEFNSRDQAFGIYVYSRKFGRYNYTQDELNTEVAHRTRVYPAKDRQGRLISGQYLITFEDAANGDYQDYVFLLDNVRPVLADSTDRPAGPWLTVENLTKLPGTDRGFPAEDFYSFQQVLDRVNPIEQNIIAVHDQNTMRLRNAGTEPVVVSAVDISSTDNFTYEFVNPEITLPFTLLPNEFTDLTLTFVRDEGFKEVVQEQMIITSTSDSGQVVATLSGAYMVRADNRNEISAPQATEALGFSTQFTDSFPISGTFPTAAEVAAGVHGDLIYSPGLVQADPDQPIVMAQVAALHSYGNANGTYSRLALASDYQTDIPGSLFRHDGDYHQTILPRSETDESQIAGVALATVSDTFQVAVGPYYTGGGAFSAQRPDELLGARMYKAIDSLGNVIPYTYLIIQDYISANGDGCGTGSSSNNCDFNDNIVYITNVRPAEVPTASPIADTTTEVSTPFTYDVSTYFDAGYLGNNLSYTLEAVNNLVPEGLSIDPTTGVISGTLGNNAPESLVLVVTATDVNGLLAQSDFELTIEGGTTIPTITSLGDQVHTQGDTLNNLPILSIEDTQAALFHRATGLPEGLVIDDTTGTVSGVVAADTGSYPVTVVTTFGPDSVENSLVWTIQAVDDTVVTSVPETAADQHEVKLYPNPSDGLLWVEFTEERSEEAVVNVVIYDARGRRWLDNTETLSRTDHRLRFDIASLPPAVYTVRIVNGSTVTTQKLLKRY